MNELTFPLVMTENQGAETARPTPPMKLSVHALLVAHGIKQKDIARKYGIAASDLNRVIHGIAKTLHIRQKIATELGMEFQQVWGQGETRVD